MIKAKLGLCFMSVQSNAVKLKDQARRVFVVAHNEDTTELESALGLGGEGFHVHTQRGPYSEEQLKFSASLRCLVNHANVWRRVCESGEIAIVVEADFVPVIDFATRISPLPQDLNDQAVGFAWLYSAGSILYGFDKNGFPHGHGNTTVAYVLTSRCAALLLKFSEREVTKSRSGDYSRWETYMGIYLRKECGVLNYIPVRQYGEHGGMPQPEHAQNGARSWHQADVLMDRLAFMPAYANGSWRKYALYRIRAILRGWVRLFLLRFYDPRYVNSDSSKSRLGMAAFSVLRLIAWRSASDV